jgi:hypothetical protein
MVDAGYGQARIPVFPRIGEQMQQRERVAAAGNGDTDQGFITDMFKKTGKKRGGMPFH